jgi:hypothetical protein
MKVQLESTTKTVVINGVEMRCWEGASEAGVPVVAFIARIAVPEGRNPDDYEVFKSELKQCAPPRPELAGQFPPRFEL